MVIKLIGFVIILFFVVNDDFVFLDKKYVILIFFFLGILYRNIIFLEVSVVCLYCDD